MAVKIFLVGVLLYFACPTGFPVPLQIESLCKDEDDEKLYVGFHLYLHRGGNGSIYVDNIIIDINLRSERELKE